MTHLVPLGSTGWSVWRDVLIRSAGFPADGLARFAATDCAAAADRYLVGEVAEDVLTKAYQQASDAAAGQVCAIAADPLFREAVAWQNPEVLVALDGLVAAGPQGPRNVRRRGRENVVAGYWQRYVAKTETIGFFGPVCWAVVEPGFAGVIARPGRGLLRRRRTYLEYWALAAFADRLAADTRVRRWFAPVLPPHLTLDGRTVLRPLGRPVPVSAAEAAVLRW
ncbi:MAG TPA: lantibiotic dehydratase, partial [Micromonosporaceae bacterium]